MILYHGTPGINGKKIIETRVIKNECSRLWNGEVHHSDGKVVDISTTDGYVYFSSKLSLAAFYGNSNRTNLKDCNDYYVFKISIPDERLLPDNDELRINHGKKNVRTAEESLDICCCACVDFPIEADEYEIYYIHINTTDYSSALREKMYNLCREYKGKMKPDPTSIIDEIDIIADWKKL